MKNNIKCFLFAAFKGTVKKIEYDAASQIIKVEIDRVLKKGKLTLTVSSRKVSCHSTIEKLSLQVNFSFILLWNHFTKIKLIRLHASSFV